MKGKPQKQHGMIEFQELLKLHQQKQRALQHIVKKLKMYPDKIYRDITEIADKALHTIL